MLCALLLGGGAVPASALAQQPRHGHDRHEDGRDDFTGSGGVPPVPHVDARRSGGEAPAEAAAERRPGGAGACRASSAPSATALLPAAVLALFLLSRRRSARGAPDRA
jgi:MYXO-CTERM domain-containing protein